MSAPVIVFVSFVYQSDLASNRDLIIATAEDNHGTLDHGTKKSVNDKLIYEHTYHFDRLWNAIWFIAQLAGMLHQGIIWIGFQGGTGI